MTTIAQLAITSDADGLSTLATAAVAAFLLAVLLYILAITFSIKAQANNYIAFLDLSASALALLGVREKSRGLLSMERRWTVFFCRIGHQLLCRHGPLPSCPDAGGV